jgi:hypothetical protein
MRTTSVQCTRVPSGAGPNRDKRAALDFLTRPGLLEVIGDLYSGDHPGRSVPALPAEEIWAILRYLIAIGAAEDPSGGSEMGQVAITDKGRWIVNLLCEG